MEMDVERLFSLSGAIAIGGWLALAIGVLVRRPRAVRVVARTIVPLILAGLYAALLVGFWHAAPDGGFSSLAAVTALFAVPELLLAGWIHYLAFDLLVGGLIAEDDAAAGRPRALTVGTMALTFLAGPIGYLAHRAFAPAFGKRYGTTEMPA